MSLSAVMSLTSLVSLISLVSLTSLPLGALSLGYAETPCPALLTERETHSLIQRLTALCDQRSALKQQARRARRVVDPRRRLKPPQWEVESTGWSISSRGAVGWRIYRPLSATPDRLPIAARPPWTCRHARSLFEREGAVWMLERWSATPPPRQAERPLTLAHAHYATQRVYLVSALPDQATEALTPRGVCPILTPHVESERVACGVGSPPRPSEDQPSSSSLMWSRE